MPTGQCITFKLFAARCAVLRRTAIALVFLTIVASPLEVLASSDWRWYPIDEPCNGNCAVSVYGGFYVENAMSSIFLEDFIAPWNWNYDDDYIVGAAVSRRVLSFFDAFHLEPEIGIAQRFGHQDATEFWGALYLRYTKFPWNNFIYTTIAVSTGLNYATNISDQEKERSGKGKGSHLMHYLSPEITFALPDRRDFQLMFRFHHRSGAYGLISDSEGGAHYGTIGMRVSF